MSRLDLTAEPHADAQRIEGILMESAIRWTVEAPPVR
jgi:hypothetical protein